MEALERNNIERYINLICPEPIDLSRATDKQIKRYYREAVTEFADLAAQVVSGDEYRDILEDLVYICVDEPGCDLSMIADDVIFVANNVEHNNPNWTALQAGVPFEDVLA